MRLCHPIATIEVVHYWCQQRDRMLRELSRRIETNEEPEGYQLAVKERYVMIMATIRALEASPHVTALDYLKQQIEMEERGYLTAEHKLLSQQESTHLTIKSKL